MMKLLLYISLVFSVLSTQAQIILDRNDFAKINDNFILGVVEYTPQDKIRIESFGEKNWDFSNLIAQTFDTIRFLDPAETRYGKRFPSSNLAMMRKRLDMLYWFTDDKISEKVGVIDDYLKIDAVVLLNFSDKILHYNFPVTLNSSFSDTARKHFLTPYFTHPDTDSIRAEMVIIENTLFDAEGSVKTPKGEYKVLREKQTVRKKIDGYKFTFYGWTPAPEYTQNTTKTYYRWYSKKGGFPIADAETDKNGFVIKIRFQHLDVMSLSYRARNVKCKYGKDGMIDLEVKGGIPDYKFKWSNGSTRQKNDSLAAGTYFVTVTDNKGTSITESYSITEPLEKLAVTFDKKDVSCFGQKNGSVNMLISGGDPKYRQKWANDSTGTSLGNLIPGTYKVKVMDKNYCIISDSVVIKQPQKPLNVDLIPTHVKCNKGMDGEISVTIDGGTPEYSYKWSNGLTSKYLKNLSAGEYSLVVTDKNNCTASANTTINEPKFPIEMNLKPTPVRCFGEENGAITLIIKGGVPGYNYLWSDSTTQKDLRGMKTGFYRVKVTDRNLCTKIDSAFISQPSDSLKIAYTSKNISCFNGRDGEITIIARGGTPQYTYSWANGIKEEKLKNLPAGRYKITVTDSKNCKAGETIDLISPEDPVSIKADIQHVKCFEGIDGGINLEVTGGTPSYTFNWSNGKNSKNNSGLKKGIYSVKVTDKNGCLEKQEYTVNEPETKLNLVPKVKNTTCPGDTNGIAEINVTGGIPGYTYKWSNGSEDSKIENLKPGNYSVVVTDGRGCEQKKDIRIDPPEKIKLSYKIKQPNVDKSNGTIEFSISGGAAPYKLLWNETVRDKKIENIPAGNYSVSVIDSNQCVFEDKVEVKAK